MQANELRIGNYVTLIGNDEPDEVVSLLTIDEIDGCYYNSMPFQGTLYNQIDNCWCLFKIIHPTPLTVDWLKKFGFKKEKISSYDKADYSWIYTFKYDKHHYSEISIAKSKENGELYIFVGEGTPIPNNIIYVHELQNLHYALTGKELILNNNRNENNRIKTN